MSKSVQCRMERRIAYSKSTPICALSRAPPASARQPRRQPRVAPHKVDYLQTGEPPFSTHEGPPDLALPEYSRPREEGGPRQNWGPAQLSCDSVQSHPSNFLQDSTVTQPNC